MAYFWIEYGLRGAYAGGNGYVIKADTRKELKAALEYEARDLRDAGMVGANKRAVSWLANAAWKARKAGGYPFVVPVEHRRGAGKAWGIHCAPSCRSEYLAQEN